MYILEIEVAGFSGGGRETKRASWLQAKGKCHDDSKTLLEEKC